VQTERRCARWKHIRIGPYTPRTNGKAERSFATLLHEWAYERAYRNSAFRATALPHYLRFYNTAAIRTESAASAATAPLKA